MKWLALSFVVLAGVAGAAPAEPASVADLYQAFERPPDDARILMRWWWFGPAVTRPELEREMRLMKEGGIGGFEVQPVYPLALDDAATGIHNFPYLSEEFLGALRFTSDKARELGLRMDLTLGSGWPYGGPHVPITQAAGKLRWEREPVAGNSRRVPLPYIAEGEKLLAAFAAGSARELTDIHDGAVWLPRDAEPPREIWFFVSSRTGMMVKRPAVGAEGFVLDHYDRAAIENHLKNVADRMMQAIGPHPPYAVFCDSLEVYGSDWSPDFLEQFQKRRGYDIQPHLPALVADAGPQTRAVRYDWGKTLTELLNERFLAPMEEWARRNGTRFRVQAYGMPPAAVSSYALADLPEGEGAQWKILAATRWASSASHIYGHPVTSSETWTWLHSPVFRATPLDVKAEADRHFLQGINQLIGHGWPYTAPGVDYPGWRFYASGVWNDKNPWWIVMPDLSLYLQRLSFLLREGKPANDVALYLPNSDAWSRFSPGRVNLFETLRARLGSGVVARILEAGYDLDFFDDGALEQAGRVEKGALALGPNRYRVVVLPGVESIPTGTFRKLEEFARGGGILVATRRLPDAAPGFLATEAEQNQIREISRRLFAGPSAPAHFVKDENGQLGSTLAHLLRPDVSFSPPAPEIGFVHRSASFAQIYFLANTGNVRQSVKATFRVEGMGAEWWDPVTGKAMPAEITAQNAGATTVALDLEPYGSRVLVFSKRPASPQAARAPSVASRDLDLSAGWRVSFGNSSRPVTMERLRSWTDEEETRYYSGLATYEKEVNVPEGFLRAGIQVRLDLGEGKPIPETRTRNGMQAWLDAPVREAAVVYVNGRRAGSVWCPPYSIEVTELLRPGENRLRIVVANLAINHMAGRRLPNYRLLNLRYGVRFEAQDMDKVRPQPAGLFGPIRLMVVPALPLSPGAQ
ncbi:MAG TPA: glycosyl hydrolase [Bryobacterales bacterium]|nr:glycosyl hydrolase [Bryobacterales bacterium]